MLAKNPEDSLSPIFPSSVAEKFPIYSRLIYSVVIMPWHDNSMTNCCIKTKLPFDTCLSIIFAPKIRKAKTDCSISRNSFSSYKINPLVYINTKLTLLTALKFFNSLHFPFDKLRILLSFLLTHLRSFRRSVGDMSFFRAGFERTENAICAEIVVVLWTQNKETPYFVNNFVPLRLEMTLETWPEDWKYLS